MQMSSILPAQVLQEEYLSIGLSDAAWEYVRQEMLSCMSNKIPFRYRNKDNQQPSLEGNFSEGSTTEESLSPFFGYGGNSCLDGVTHLGMPGTQVLSGDTV